LESLEMRGFFFGTSPPYLFAPEVD
jgi:hypothetical protein